MSNSPTLRNLALFDFQVSPKYEDHSMMSADLPAIIPGRPANVRPVSSKVLLKNPSAHSDLFPTLSESPRPPGSSSPGRGKTSPADMPELGRVAVPLVSVFVSRFDLIRLLPRSCRRTPAYSYPDVACAGGAQDLPV
ncbi:unnamed protein product [Diplocarpon coronariae]